MKFDKLYSKLLREMDVASVFGAAAGDGDMTNGWGSDDDGTLKLAMAISGTSRKKKKPKKNKKKKLGETDQIAYSKGPVHAGDITMQRRPSIGTM